MEQGRSEVRSANCMLIAKQSAVYQLKTPYQDDTTHFVFEPIQFLARLAALVLRDREFAHAAGGAAAVFVEHFD